MVSIEAFWEATIWSAVNMKNSWIGLLKIRGRANKLLEVFAALQHGLKYRGRTVKYKDLCCIAPFLDCLP
jgi:hypothetical protein